jgi:hypothetical protein
MAATTTSVTPEQLPTFEEIPNKRYAPINTQCSKCKKEFLEVKVELVNMHWFLSLF